MASQQVENINNLKNVKANAGIVQTWLSGTVFSASQHALLRMQLINQNGEVEIKLGQQSGAKSTFVIRYEFADEDQENHKHQELNQVEIEDHERQLTFHCKSMNQDDPHRAEAQEHLDMLEKVRKLVDFAIKLEQEGHPEYQQHTIRQDQAIFQLSLNKRDLIDRRVRTLESHLDEWQKCLDDQRIRCPPMLMFSSGEISNMLVLLRPLHAREDDNEDIVATNETIAANLLNAAEDEIEVDDISLASHLFALYLRSAAPIATLNEPLLHERWGTLVKWFTKPDDAVRALSRLLMEMNDVVHFDNAWRNLPPTAAAQQHVVELAGSVEKPSAVFLTILNLCQSRQRVPSSYEILWCEGDGSNLTNSDLELFFKRVAVWRGGLFFIVHPDLLNPSLQKVIIEHSRWLCDQDGHGELIFITASKSHVFSHVSSYWLRPRATPNIADGSTAQVLQSFRSNADATALLECLQQRPSLTLVNGINSFGKTHFIKHKYLTQQEPPQVLRVTVNDKMDRLNLARHLVPMTIQGALDADATPNLLIISVSFQAELQSVNRLLFDLLVLGAIRGEKNGLICSLPASSHSWQIVVEWPNEARDYGQLASLLTNHNEKIDSVVEHPLVIGTSERLVASLLALVETANQPQNVLRTLAVNDTPLQFPLETNDEKCRQLIERKVADMEGYNRLHVSAFVSLLNCCARFFQVSSQFLYNQTQQNQNLGFIMATQMLSEVNELMQPMFPVGIKNSPLPAYVVYDSSMSPKLLVVNWNHVNNDLGRLLGQPRNVPNNPERMWEELLTWAFNVNSVNYVTEVFEAFQFVLVPDYAYRLIFIHERKLSRLPLVIESDTGVGKTFLLQVYSGLLNQQIVHDRTSEHFPRVISRLCLYLRDQIKGVSALEAAFDSILAAEAFGSAADDFEFTDVFSLIRNLITQLPREQHVTFIQKLKAHIHQLYNQFLLLQRDDSFDQIEEVEEDEAAEFDKVLNLAMKLASLPLREVFFRLLIHPGVTEADMKKFMVPIIQLAEDVPDLEPVVFFDEVNTASILGLFKEMLIDRYMVGQALPPNIFFIAAINPFTKETAVNDVATAGIASLPASVGRFNVHDLPSSLKQLRWHYGPLDGSMLRAYIEQKIQSLRPADPEETLPFVLDINACQLLMNMLFEAHRFFIKRLGPNAVSQRDLQRVFKIMQFFWRVSPVKDRRLSPGKAVREAVLMAIAAVYYFRLPMREEAQQFMADGRPWPLREELADLLTQHFGSPFSVVVKEVIDRIIDARNFFIPAGIALNQALKENMICTLISICTKVPGSIIGKPGTSKTLSFQLVAQNMKGEMSQTDFCKLLPRVDPFFCQCSEDSTPEDVSTVLDQAIDRQQVYDARNENTQAVVFMDNAGLSSNKRMVLKVLHQYLDECRVSFIAISNEAFDPANANRMMQVVRSTGSIEDTLVLALGCLGLTNTTNNTYHRVAKALCEAWSDILAHPEFNKLFHHRDFIYMMRHLQRESGSNNGSMFTPIHVLQALERNFSGISKELFHELVDIVFGKIRLVDPSFTNPEATDYRNSIQLLKQALGPQVMPDQRNGVFDANTRIRPRFKLVLDPTGDDSGSGLLFDFNLLDQVETEVIRMSDFVDDNHELYRVELLSKIKNCMEVGRRILLVRASPLHGSLYDVFNQNFTTVLGEERDGGGVYSMIAIGARTEHCLVHPKFECIVHLRTSDLSKTPAPFLDRFEKYLLDIEDFYNLQLNRFCRVDQEMIQLTRKRCEEFVNTIGINNFYGIAKDTSTTMATLLLSHMDTSSEQPSFQPLSSLPDSVVRIMEFDQHADAKDSFVLNVRALMFKLIQLLPAEAVVVKLLPSTTNAKMFARLYFQHQEHFSLEAFSDKLTSTTAATAQKLVIYARANSLSSYLSQVVHRWHAREKSLVTMIEADGCQQQQAFVDQLTTFIKNINQRVVYVVINATTQKKTVGHVSYIRQLIDDTINASTKLIAPDVLKRKTFALMLAFTPESINSASCYPSVFLCGWKFHFLDLVSSGSANYIHRFSASFCNSDDETIPQTLVDFCFQIHLPPTLLDSQTPFKNEHNQGDTPGTERAKQIAEALKHNTTVTILDLPKNEIGVRGAKHIAEALKQNQTLTMLGLVYCNIDDDGAKHIAEALKQNTTLTTLDLGYCNIGDEGAKHIAEALKQNTTLTTLDLGYNSIGVEGAKSVAEALKYNKTLTELGVMDNTVGDEGTKHITEALKHNKTLTTLNLGRIYISAEGAKHIADALKHNTTLTTLNLKSNYIRDEGIKHIAEVLKQNQTLTMLGLVYCNIGIEGAKHIAEALKHNTTLTTLLAWGNDIGEEEIKLDLLMKRNNDMAQVSRERGYSLLHAACFVGDVDLVSWLIENGDDVYCVNLQGQTASEIARSDAIQHLLRVAESNPVSILKRVAYVRKLRPTMFGVLPDASLNSLLQKLQVIDCNQLVVPGLDELAMTESLKLRLLDTQEQLRKAGNDAAPEAIQTRNQLRRDLARSIQEVRAIISSDATKASIALLQSWLSSLKDDPSLVDDIHEDNDLGAILKNILKNAIDASVNWIKNSDEDVQQRIRESDATFEELSQLLELASKCILQDQPALPGTKNFASATTAVKKALSVERSLCESLLVIPQDIVNSLKRAALLVIATIEDVLRQFTSVQAAADDFLPWLQDAQPWLNVDAYPTKLLEEVDAAQNELVNIRERIAIHDAQYTAAQKRRTASREQLRQMADEMTQHKQKVSLALSRLHTAQVAAIVVFSAHFPELLSNELVSEFARLDGLKLSSASFADFTLVETIHTRNKVHKAIDFEGNFCALKEYPPLNQDESMREARILHRLNHPAVASVIAVFFDKSFYFQMPWYDQGTLSEWGRTTPRPSSQQLQQVLREVLSAIDYIHANKVIHGDIKPQNIMMTTRQGRTLPQPVLADFDLAKQMDGPSVSRLTHAAGTLGFIAPELSLPGQRRSCKSDMYAFGITMIFVNNPEARLDNPSLPANANPSLISVVNLLRSSDPRQRPTARQAQMEAYFAEALHDVDYDRRQLPTYWEISMEQANRIVDVTNSLGNAIQKLITKTCISKYIGIGRDSHGLTHTAFAVERVDRVENGLMWRAYAERKIQIRRAWQKVASIGDIKTASFARSTPGGLDDDINEIYAFHGAPANIIDIIKSTGMDERVTSSGLFGGGLYFAENSSKSDEYVVPDSNGLCYMVLARVCMGAVFETQELLPGTDAEDELPTTRRAPCINGCLLNTACDHHRYDSVRADIGGVLKRYREFVVYDRFQVYPEYIISFRRV